ncbi:hypothetical protein Tco_1031307 [Tanacetum coccineum]|uniref:Uncharacterized protein n=1 Tax=Tanacetum coccineum TaxID=301880 RepID=A0ABQ5G8Z2_9ASTR
MSKGEEHQKYEMSILDSIMNDAIRSLDSYQTYLALSTNTKAAIPKKERQRLSVVLKKATTPRKKSLITANDNILPDPDEALKPDTAESEETEEDEILLIAVDGLDGTERGYQGRCLGEVVEAEKEQVIAPVIDVAEGQMDAPMIDMEEDLAALFGDDDFEDDASDGFSEEEVWEVNEDWLMAPTTPPPVLAVPPPSVYEVGGPSTTRVNQVSDAGVAAGVTIGEIGPRVYAVEGQVQVVVSQIAHVVDRWEQVGAQVEQGQQAAAQRDETVTGLTQQVQALQIEVQQRDMQIQQLQTTVSEMSSRESSLMQCILGLRVMSPRQRWFSLLMFHGQT